MAKGIFVTGGGGFVGRRVLAALKALDRPVIALDRSGALAASSAESSGVTTVRGDLLDPSSYRAALDECDVVVHLAAATGRASRADHFRVNAEGTERLLDACAKAGVSRFLFVSSIATGFESTAGYHYAQAKLQAEASARRSGIRFTILRPTIILGDGAPLLASLEKLALLPVVVVPGNGRARVQPIQVDAVAGEIARIVRDDDFTGRTIDLGGPEVLSIEALLQQVRSARTGRPGRVVHIPLPLLQVPLRIAEAAGLGRLLPITAGQLLSFRFDGIARVDRPVADVTVPIDRLDAECRTFTRHLLGIDADAYVMDRYRKAHVVLPVLAPDNRFDQALVAFARRGRVLAKIADAFAGVFRPAATLRKKLVVLLAILETRPPFHLAIDKAVSGPIGLVGVRVVLRSTIAVLSLAAGVLIFLPMRLVLPASRKTGR